MDGIPVSGRVVIGEDELSWRFSRSSGPGGQGVNTTDSRAELRWWPASTAALSEFQRVRALDRLADRLVDGAVVVVASEYRSQHRNRDAARDRLADIVRAAIAPPPPTRRPTRPSRSATRRRVDDKKRRGDIKRLRRSTDD
ncbi:aminoacyl-tRNA hydrolase [Nakamurella flavida]|uniref:Aminoacyl-tRNA hydrolase n=1 Tax=Nakamurella flavida TaxID=363630 RepID=A0A939C1W2_9ACTN|nr:alternative ribosome rescue aminoacyl-tRNA hydrolase ArfB [Nakamurella flavida]MBM9478108.1 aminoacyl-tRNA hydrolase [Nakamurella flavida]MDP9778671.1 ribosome-associated protein [Nakamurella flavida]